MTLESAWGKQWQEVLGDTGFGKMTLANDDPDLALVEYGQIVVATLDGTPRFLWLVEKQDRVDVDDNEEFAEATTVSGRGALAVLEDGVVYPDIYIETVPFADARIFNFSSFFAVNGDNGFVENSTGIYDWGTWGGAAAPYTNIPTGFPDGTAHWLSPQAPDGGGAMPDGEWYVVSLLTGVAEGQYRLSVCADDSLEAYVDNVPIHKAEGVFGRLITEDLWLDSALHVLAFKITNLPFSAGFGGPTGIIWSLAELNTDGTLGSVVWHSHPTASALDFYSPYPSEPPGFTPGEVMDILLVEAQGRGCFTTLNYDFDEDEDSAGVPWAERIQPSFQIGTDLLTVIKQLGESYLIPRIDPDLSGGLMLHVYQSLGSASGVEYERGENITALRHQGTF